MTTLNHWIHSSISGRCPGFRLGHLSALLPIVAFAFVLTLAAAAPVFAADCTDTDGDGYVTCSGCTAGGNLCGDCAEGNAARNPGETEICNGIDDNCAGGVDDIPVPDPVDGIDNDFDGLIDERLGPCIFHQEGPANECKTGGGYICLAGVLTCDNPNGADAIIHYAAESLAAGNCEDGINNDCDNPGLDGVDNDGDTFIDEADEFMELTDIADPACQEPEKCDNKDNDGDGVEDNGFDVGAACTAGQGVCLRNGVKICKADGTDTECSASAGTAKNEGATFGISCGDGKDNDCDGDTDLADDQCAGFGDAELCGNGTDDDGDGIVDEGFPTLGLACSSGVGACTSFGVQVCKGDGTGTECGAVAGSPTQEGTGSGNCVDVVDNDCDGLVDAADPDCSGAYEDLGAYCSLPYLHGQPGSDCTGKHIITFGAAHGTVKAELMAFDTDGTLLAVLPNIVSGDEGHLASRMEPADFKWVSRKNKQRTSHMMFAPMPLLRVTATQNGVEDVAWCGIMPWLDVTDPDGLTLSLSETNELEVKAFLPLVNVDTLTIQMDGVDILADILADLGTNTADALPTGNTPLCAAPGSCVFPVPAGCGDAGTVDVEIRNLKVEGLDTSIAATAKIGTGTPNQVNTLSFDVIGLPPGGHIFYVNGSPLPLTKNVAAVCLVDDTTDTGIASAFGIRIDSPTDQQLIASAPVQVQGKVCGGNEVATFRINGKDVDVTPDVNQTCTPGNGTTVAPECVVPFDEAIGKTDLSLAVAGTAPLGTFKRGTNRVIADAADILGSRTFNTDVLFGLGPVQTPSATLTQSLNRTTGNAINEAYQAMAATVTTTIDPSISVGIDESAARKFFNEKCTDAINTFTARVEANLEGDSFGEIDAEPGCSCNLYNVPVKMEEINFGTLPDPACVIEFQTDQIVINVQLPDISIQVGAHDSCTDHGLFGECIARTIIDVTAVTKIQDLAFGFTITETQIETDTPPDPASKSFTWEVVDPDGTPLYSAAGTCIAGDQIGKECFGDASCLNGGAGSCSGAVKNESFDNVTHNGSDIECWGADLCGIFQFIGFLFVEIFTLGFADGADIVGIIDFDFDFQEDFFAQLDASEPDPFDTDGMTPDPDAIKAPGTIEFTAGPRNVEIEPGGMTVTFGGDWAVVIDPAQPLTPPPAATNAAAPTVPQIVGPGDEVSIMLADDVFNQILYSERRAGKLTAFCSDLDGLTVDDLLPPDCETLTGATAGATATAQGLCHGARGADCETLVATTSPVFNTPIKQGACHGIKHDDCTTIPAVSPLIEKASCNLFKTVNLSASDALLVCGRLDAEPDMLFRDDDTSDNTVFTDVLLNDFNIVFTLDRANDGYIGSIDDLKGCFTAEGSAAPDCLIYSACLDLTMKARLGIDNSTCSPTQTGYVFDVFDVIKTGFVGGVLCAAAIPTDDPIVLDNGADSTATDAVADASEAFAPAFCMDGLNFGDTLTFTSAGAKMFAITTTGVEPGFADWVGLTGSLVSPP